MNQALYCYVEIHTRLIYYLEFNQLYYVIILMTVHTNVLMLYIVQLIYIYIYIYI